jgi:uncharacterized repeat protein (TIGR01451 family)
MRVRRTFGHLAVTTGVALTLGVIALGGTTAAASVPAAVASAQPAPPQLSIAVSDEKDSATAGDELAYTIIVENVGSVDVPGLVVTQTLPGELQLVSTDPAVTADGSTVSWTVDLVAAQTATFRSTVTVGESPDTLLRVATTVCAAVSPTDAPLVCASDSDELPAGAAAAAASDSDSDEQDGTAASPGWLWPTVIAAVVVIALLLLLGALLRRRRRASAAEGPRLPVATESGREGGGLLVGERGDLVEDAAGTPEAHQGRGAGPTG